MAYLHMKPTIYFGSIYARNKSQSIQYSNQNKATLTCNKICKLIYVSTNSLFTTLKIEKYTK
jgi:hypothetical protein